MADYLAQRIIDGALKYSDVIAKYSTLKADIDTYLTAHGHSDLIVS